MGFGHYMGSRLHRRLFAWFGAVIFATGAVVGAVWSLAGAREMGWRSEVAGAIGFVSRRFASVWEDPAQRSLLLRDLGSSLAVDVTLRDAQHRPLESFGQECDREFFESSVERGGRVVGYVSICPNAHRHKGWALPFALVAAGVTLWAGSGLIARRIVRPLSDLVRVTREIGAGKLKSRVRLGRHHRGEVGVLADSINDMAIRIERQMREQRELLAAVSHEIRSPLSRMRVLVELLRERAPDQKRIDQLERELVEIDSLVGKLLASSRLDFEALSWHLLVAGDMARRAVERCGLSLDLVRDRSEGATFEGDATLVERALANLIENAVQHAGSVQAVDVATEGDKVQFEVHDLGAGFAPAALQRAFEPFYRGESASGKNGPSASNSGAPSGSLGLGLALVHRIATAHGGRAWAKNRPEGGASVGFCVRRRG